MILQFFYDSFYAPRFLSFSSQSHLNINEDHKNHRVIVNFSQDRKRSEFAFGLLSAGLSPKNYEPYDPQPFQSEL